MKKRVVSACVVALAAVLLIGGVYIFHDDLVLAFSADSGSAEITDVDNEAWDRSEDEKNEVYWETVTEQLESAFSSSDQMDSVRVDISTDDSNEVSGPITVSYEAEQVLSQDEQESLVEYVRSYIDDSDVEVQFQRVG